MAGKADTDAQVISIHAPARGATRDVGVDVSLSRNFNSRPRAGGDQAVLYKHGVRKLFQFTPPRGGRPDMEARIIELRKFQFTPPRGGRLRGGSDSRESATNFNSRPRAGGDVARMALEEQELRFQFTPPRGGRQEPDRV